jgi:cell division transport system permease protein
MLVALFFVGSIIFMSQILNNTIAAVSDKVDVDIYFVPDAEESEILSLQNDLEQLPEVESITYINREDNLDRFQSNPQNQDIVEALEILEENPLGAVLRVKAENPSQYESVAAYLESTAATSQDNFIEEVNFINNKEVIDRLDRIITLVNQTGLIIAIILVVISFLITFNTIRLVIFTARHEIHVMRLVGASSAYIRGPFIVTGFIYGIVASVLTLLLFYPLTFYVGDKTEQFFVGLNLFEFYIDNFLEIFLVIVGFGVLIGIVSSYLAVRKYLRV